MSANVWFQEVETGLVNEILKSVKYLSTDGNITPLSPSSVFVRSPETEFKEENYPCVTIYSMYSDYDVRRHNPSPVVVAKSTELGMATLEDSAIPYNLDYQIDFWCRYIEDKNIMTKTWLEKHFRQFNLPVIDDGGTPRTCNVQVLEPLRSVDLTLGGKRLFHSVISYRIWVELDNETRYNVNIVGTADLTVGPNQ